MRVYAREKAFYCGQCTDSLAETDGKKEHMIVHTDERKLSCEQCAKSLAWRRHREAQAEQRQLYEHCAEVLPGNLFYGTELPG